MFSYTVAKRKMPLKLQEWEMVVLENILLKHMEFVTSGRALGEGDAETLTTETKMDAEARAKIFKRMGHWRQLNYEVYKLESTTAQAHRAEVLRDDRYGFDIMEVNKRAWLNGTQSPEVIRTFVTATELVDQPTEWDFF
jgi:hypothetical protein